MEFEFAGFWGLIRLRLGTLAFLAVLSLAFFQESLQSVYFLLDSTTSSFLRPSSSTVPADDFKAEAVNASAIT